MSGMIWYALLLVCTHSGTRTSERIFALSSSLNCSTAIQPYGWNGRQLELAQKAELSAVLFSDGMAPLSGIMFAYNSNAVLFLWFPTMRCAADILDSVTFTAMCSDRTDVIVNGKGDKVVDAIDAYSVRVAWQSDDLLMTFATSTISTPLATSAVSTKSVIPTSSNSSNSNISASSKIAIGVIVPLAVLGPILVPFLLTISSQRYMVRNTLAVNM